MTRRIGEELAQVAPHRNGKLVPSGVPRLTRRTPILPARMRGWAGSGPCWLVHGGAVDGGGQVASAAPSLRRNVETAAEMQCLRLRTGAFSTKKPARSEPGGLGLAIAGRFSSPAGMVSVAPISQALRNESTGVGVGE
jgi:hypothetical protein